MLPPIKKYGSNPIELSMDNTKAMNTDQMTRRLYSKEEQDRIAQEAFERGELNPWVDDFDPIRPPPISDDYGFNMDGFSNLNKRDER